MKRFSLVLVTKLEKKLADKDFVITEIDFNEQDVIDQTQFEVEPLQT